MAVVFYYVHFIIFTDVHHIGIFFLGDLAFLPIEVMLVSLVFNRLLIGRGREIVFEKLNSIMGIFFNEVGKDFLFFFSKYDIV